MHNFGIRYEQIFRGLAGFLRSKPRTPGLTIRIYGPGLTEAKAAKGERMKRKDPKDDLLPPISMPRIRDGRGQTIALFKGSEGMQSFVEQNSARLAYVPAHLGKTLSVGLAGAVLVSTMLALGTPKEQINPHAVAAFEKASKAAHVVKTEVETTVTRRNVNRAVNAGIAKFADMFMQGPK
jgi:hypothetical protein